MRFHHSTRRGRNRFSQANSGQTPASSRFSGNPNSRWSQLGYCRETNIHFNRRLPVECPEQFGASLDDDWAEPDGAQLGSLSPLSYNQSSDTHHHHLDHHQHRHETSHQHQHNRNHNHHHHNQHSQHNQQIQRTIASHKAIQQNNLSNLTTTIEQREISGPTTPPAAINQQKRQQEAGKLRRSNHQEEQKADGSSGSLESQTSSDDIDSIRQRLVDQVAKHHFWSRKAAKRMHFTHLETRQIYIYELLSYCERRDLEWRYEPFRGGMIGLAGVALSGRKDSPPDTAIHSARPSSLGALSSRTLEPGAVQQVVAAATSSGHLQSLPESDVVWSIEAPAKVRPEPFVGSVHSAELPGSSFVKRCHGCQGRGRLKCNSCHGVGYEVCLSCSGRGLTSRGSSALASSRRSAADSDSPSAFYGDSRLNDTSSGRFDSAPGQGSPFSSHARGAGEPGGICSNSDGQQSGGWLTESCAFCHGAGQKRCWVCAGRSYNSCLGCQGSGQLRCYLNLNITWLNHRDESVINNTDNIIPRERLRLCSGLVLVDETGDHLNPLAGRGRRWNHSANETLAESGTISPKSETVTMAPEGVSDRQPLGQVVLDASQLHQASKRLLQRHASAYRHQRLIRQRHKVTQIECQIVSYEWKQRRGHFVIYGLERKVYIAKYPFKSICSIT